MARSRTTRPIAVFRDRYAFLSNFYPDDGDGGTLEHRFQAAKTRRQPERDWVLSAPTPAEAKRRGRRVMLVRNWEQVKDKVMLDLLREKFTDPDLRTRLLETGSAELIEGNTWGDTYWGVCNGRGLNKLGVLLMQVRDEIREEQNDD